MSVLVVTLVNEHTNAYEVEVQNGPLLGDIYKEVDGYYVFAPLMKGGYWPEWFLRGIADKLAEMNKEWDELIAREIGDGEEPTV